jgi:fructokinase
MADPKPVVDPMPVVDPKPVTDPVPVAPIRVQTDPHPSDANEGNLDWLARRLQQRGPELVLIKRGSQGAYLRWADRSAEHPGFPAQVVDTTGAGDAVAAAVVLAYQKGMDARQTVLLANAMGAATVERLGGGLNIPAADDVRAVLQRAGLSDCCQIL